jgi:hypothetical protein
MAYGVRYRIEYKDCANVDKKIDIEELDYTGARTDCEAGEYPLQIEMPGINNVFEPVITTGATLGMISTSNLMFLGLYSINPKKLRVKIYAAAATDPFWLGYVNTEVYNESYAMLQDYEVSISCNDGFAVLERFKYLDGSAHYTGFDTKWNILLKILAVMGLPYKYLYFACEHSADGVTVGSTETLFHQLKADQANYYDEKGDPMICMEVLKGLLASYPLQIRWHDGSIYIYDPSMLADASFSAKKFDASGTFISSGTISRNLDISNEDCEWDSDDQAIDRISGYSKQVIRFSPYGYDHAVPLIDLADEANWTGTPVWTLFQQSGHPDIYYLSGITAVAGFTLGVGLLSGKRENLSSTPDIYIKGTYGSGSGSLFFENTTAGIWLAGVEGSSILFKAKVFVRTKTWEYDDNEESERVSMLVFKIAVEIGAKRPNFVNFSYYEWITSTTLFINIPIYNSGQSIADQWVDVEFPFPWNFPSGEMVFKVYDDFKAYAERSDFLEDNPLSGSVVSEIRFKEIEFVVIDVKDPPYGGKMFGAKYEPAALNDKEYTGRVNEDFANEAPELTLIHADGINVADRGGIRKSDKSYTTGWNKPGDSVNHLLAEIHLRTIISQYKESLVQLSGTLTAVDIMTGANCLAFFNTIQDTDYLSTIKLICTGGVYNDFKRTLNGTFLEIKQDDLSIVIE